MPSIFRKPSVFFNALQHLTEFRLGWQEARGDGRTYEDDPGSPRSLAYDAGRDLRRWGRA